MELKWLEDFVRLAATRSFSRAAEERHVTQSAFSRRIRALETWLGVVLVDRTTQPMALTEAGRRFLETAEETVRQLYASRQELQAQARPKTEVVAIAALHTLALHFFPHWFRRIEACVGPLQSRLLPDGLLPCLKALTEDDFDFMLMLHHPAVPILVEPADYPHRVVGADALVAVRSAALSIDGPPPLLGYPAASLLGRMTAYAQGRDGAPPASATHTNDSAIALKFMVLGGHGFAWLPRSLVHEEMGSGALLPIAPEIPMEVRLYRNARRRRPVVETVWAAAESDP